MNELSNNTWMGSVIKEMKNTHLFVFIVVILSILITSHSTPVWAAWTDDATINKAVSTAADVQNGPRSVSDGSGGAIITWEDRRNGGVYDDIYAQRVDANGNVLWTADDVPIAVIAGSNQSEPNIVSDGSGGAIITWQDGRSADDKIYAQRVDADGSVQWTTNGVQISGAAGDHRNPTIVSDNPGGAIVTWAAAFYNPNNDPGSRYTYSIYAQKVDADGNRVWTPHDAQVSIGQSNNRYKSKPEIVSDGSGGAIITWYDNRGGTYTPDIYAQRVLAGGSTRWTIGGVPISVANGDQINAKIVSDGSGGAIITWQDSRVKYYDIYAQRVDAEGNRLWAVDGKPISTTADNHEVPEIVSDGSGGAIITWYGYYGTDYNDIYAQRVDADGTLLWGVDGKPISTEVEDQYYPQIVSDGSGGAIITWQDGRNYYDPDGEEEATISIMAVGDTGYDVYAQRVDADGNVLWTVNGQSISTAADDQNEPSIVSDGSGGAIITWRDRRNGGNYGDIYAQRVYYNSTLIDSDGDGVTDSEDDNPGNATIATPRTTTGTGKITVDTQGTYLLANVKTVSDSDPSLNQTGKPSGYEFPDGLVSFQVTGVPAGETITVTLTFPTAFPPGAEYYKSDANGFYLFSNAVISGNTVTLTLTDDGSRSGGDSNGTANDGVIDDPGGVAVPVGSGTYNPHDTNQDWIIGDFELLDAIDAWALGNLGDFELLDLIDFWAVGCYQWDDVAGKFVAGC